MSFILLVIRSNNSVTAILITIMKMSAKFQVNVAIKLNSSAVNAIGNVNGTRLNNTEHRISKYF